MGDGSRQRFLCLVGGKKNKKNLHESFLSEIFENPGCLQAYEFPAFQRKVTSSKKKKKSQIGQNRVSRVSGNPNIFLLGLKEVTPRPP